MPAQPGTGLQLQGLSKSYGSLHALTDLSFDVKPGEIFGFVGSNGAGKTTTMRIALGVLAADAGQVLWNGAPLGLAQRRQVGYMPEERGLYPKMKVGAQLIYLAELHGMTTADATAAMERWTDRLGIAERRGDEVQALSLGNQQRVQLAAALVHDPVLLVLDEPFSGLDPVAVDVMSGVLTQKAAEGVPVIFSSHQLELVERLCDRVGIVSRGKLVAQGTIAELRRTDRPQYVIGAEAAVQAHADGWLASVPGSRIVDRGADRVVVQLPTHATDEQPLLRAAVATGRVTEFRLDLPTLTSLFRDVVSADPAQPSAEGVAA